MNCCADPCYIQTIYTDCFTEENPLVIGVIDEVNTAVVIFVQNIASRRIDQYAGTSSPAGVVELFEEDSTIYLPQHTPIRIWIKDQGDLQGANLPLTFNAVEYECLEIRISA